MEGSASPRFAGSEAGSIDRGEREARGWRDSTKHRDPLSIMEGSGEQPGPQPPNPGDHRIRDGDFVVLKREDVFKAVQVQRRK